MTTKMVTVEVDTPLEEAARNLHEHGFAALPVLQNRQLAGIIFESDLQPYGQSLAAPLDSRPPLAATNGRKVADYMTRQVVTVSCDHTVEEAGDRLLNHRVSSAPVFDQRQRLVGIIAMSDLLRALVSVSGAARRGVHMAIEVEDRAGILKELSETIHRYGGRMASLFTTSKGAARGCRRAYVRIFDIDRFRLLSLLEELRETKQLVYAIDRKEIHVER